MKRKSSSQVAFFGLRILIGLASCSIGASLALSGFGVFSAAPPRGDRATQDQHSNEQIDVLQPWAIVANYPALVESSVVGSDGTYAYVAGGRISGGPSNTFNRYDPNSNSWTALPAMPTALFATRGAFAANTNSFYVFGGFNGATTFNTTYIYNAGTNSWTTGAPMPAARFFPNVAYDAPTGKIYVIGGFTSGSVEANQTWEYDPVANTWNTTRANIPAAMGGSATSIVGQFIYLAGSYAGGSGSTLHYRYDINNDAWAPMPGVPVAVYEAAGAAIGSQIYVIGGGNPFVAGDGKGAPSPLDSSHAPAASFTTTYIFDTSTLTWTTGPNTNVAHSFTGGTAISNRLLVVAGSNGTADTNTVEMTTAPPPGRKILLVQADCGTNPALLRNNLLALDPTMTVDFFNAQTGTPTLVQLQGYDIVVPFSNCVYSDAVTLGNNLVSYMNAGGVVVAFNFDWFGGNQSIQGTWLSAGYSPFNNPGSNNFSPGTLGAFTAGHPLMQGVSSLNSNFRMTMALASGATQVAAWNDATPLIAYKGRAVAVSGYVGDFSSGWSGDFARVILNAHAWLSSPGHRILIVNADGGVNPDTLRNNILAADPTTTVDVFDGGTATPTVAQLQAYDTVVPFSNFSWADSTTLGNNLVSYMNAGGVVVAFTFDWSSVATSSIQGTWVSGGYTPFNFPAANNFTAATLGTFTAGHPLMQGVSSLNASDRSNVSVAGGATQVAAWNDSIPLLAYKGRAVGVSAYVGDGGGSGIWSGDYGRVILNAGNFLGTSDLFASLNGQVNTGNTGGSILEFTSAGGQSIFKSPEGRPRGVAFDGAGNLFVATNPFDGGSGTYQSAIVKITPVGVQSTFATVSGNFFLEDLRFDTSGNLYALGNDFNDANLASTIFEFTPGGTQSTFGSVPGQSFGLAFDGAGNLFVSDNSDQTIYKFTPAGARTVFVGPAAFGPSGLQNTGFETGSFSPGWTISSSMPAPVVSNLQANTGTYSGHLGSFGPGETPGDSSFFQQVGVPSTGGTLTYWYWPRTVDNIMFDWQDAYVTNAAGTVILATVMHVCENTQVWTQITFDMSAFAGQTVGIKFLVHGDNAGDATDMFVDDVVVTRIGPAGLAFDKSGNLFVSTESASVGIDTILKFTPAGMGSTFAMGLSNPRGLAFDSMGNLFAAEVPQFSTGDILKFTPAGAQSVFASGLGRPAGNGGPEFLTFRGVSPVGAVSRKVHGGAGTFDLPLPLSGTPGIECRSGGATNDYQIIISFAHEVTVGGAPQAQVTSGTGTVGSGGVSNGGAVTVSGSSVTIPLTNIGNAQTIKVTLFGVNDGSSSGNVVIPMSRLLGDTNSNGAVTSADVSQTKSRIGQTISSANFRSDINANGAINASDTGLVKSALGTGLP
ncbi:MAG: kelch repeat-containing protein [Verrucomicrobiota bacterium]